MSERSASPPDLCR